MIKWLILILCCLCLPLQASTSNKIEKPGVIATLEDPFDLNPQLGILPLRLTIENTSGISSDFHVDINGVSDNDNQKLEWSDTFTVDNNSKHSFWVYLPIMGGLSEYRWTCTLSGRTFSDSFPNFYNHISDKENKNFLVVLYTPDIGLKFPSTLWDINPGETMIRSECSLAMFPDDWHGYLGVRSIFISSLDWRSLKEGQRLAILQYVGLGGRLLLFGPAGELEGNQLGVSLNVPQVDGMITIPFGVGDLIICDEKQLLNPFWIPGKVEKEYLVGFPLKRWAFLDELGELKAPITLIITIVMVFIIVAGPINLIFWAPITHRLRLFFTIPLISLLTSLALFIGIICTDGLGGVGKRFVLDLSLPSINSEAVIQVQASKTYMLWNSTFKVPDQASIMRYNSDDRQSSTLKIDNDVFSGNWFKTRSVQSHLLRTVRPSRNAITLINGSVPTLQSSFPVTLKELHFQLNHQYWKCSELHPGDKKVCGTESENDYKKFIDSAFVRAGPLAGLEQHLEADNTFVATGDPGVELASLESIRWMETDVVYAGQLTVAAEAKHE